MVWLAVFFTVILVDSATPTERPALLGLFFVMLALAVWCSWSEDKRRQK